jgi:hypothetical protein
MHGIAVIVLGQYGVDRAVALGFGIVLNIVTVIPLVLLGLGASLVHLTPIWNLFQEQKSGHMITNSS